MHTGVRTEARWDETSSKVQQEPDIPSLTFSYDVRHLSAWESLREGRGDVQKALWGVWEETCILLQRDCHTFNWQEEVLSAVNQNEDSRRGWAQSQKLSKIT